MKDHSETNRALSQITDAGLFERLATAVLRQADSALYGNLTHPGMSADGKTVKAPVDGIAFVSGAIPPHMVTAHHASVAVNDLRKKWLHDPSTVKPRKGTKPTAPPGDVIKTMRIVSNERNRTPGLRVTLALTTNREPPEDLTRDVTAAANSYGISIDIWSCSRLAHYLDNEPDGQWLRNDYLGIVQQKLSKQLLRELSRNSLDALPLMTRVEGLINRELDRIVADQSPRPVSFIVGESGLGKTIACYKRLKTHIEAGGCGLVLTQEILSTHSILDQALNAELRKFHTSLEPSAGTKALSLCSPDEPLLILVEDVNRSNHPALLLERLAGWGSSRDEDTSTKSINWRLFCPVWPKVLASTSDEARKRIETLSVSAAPFTKGEARDAVERSAKLVKVTISSIEADSLAEALGNDPLLIALYDFTQKPEPQQVIGDFVKASLYRLASSMGNLMLTEYQTALKALACEMLSHRRVDPNWTEVQDWLRGQPDHLTAMRQIVQGGEVVRLTDAGRTERLTFRHDRVRAWLLSEGAADLIQSGHIDDAVLLEPFFADVIGTALADPNIPVEAIDRVGVSNPLALFYALKTFRKPTDKIHQAVLNAINVWLANEETHGRSNRTLRWDALQVLSEIESPHVIAITKQFREQPWTALEARFRNGDVDAGLQLCLVARPGVGAPWRDRQIVHAKVRFGKALIRTLDEILKQRDLSSSGRSGALRMAGYLADPKLADGVAACWASDPERVEPLADYLWAVAECCGDNPEQLLKPVCDAWAALPDDAPKEGSPSPRSDLAAHEISWAFKEALPPPSLRYFIDRAREKDLHGPITYMLRGIDHPDAVEFIARECASVSRKAEETGSFWPFASFMHDDWERQQREKGKGMSFVSRQRLQQLWECKDKDKHLRCQAFQLWAATSAPDDVSLLRTIEESAPFSADILKARLKRGDCTAIPALIQEIRSDKRGYWWQLGRFIWSDDLTNVLDDDFQRRGTEVDLVWGAGYASDWITSELVMRLPPTVAERLLVKHWPHLRFSSYFVQTALYLATPTSRALAKEAILRCPDVNKILKHISMHFGIMMSFHPGVIRIEQIEALVPFLDHISTSDIHSFWDLCNKRGWFDFRHANLDDRLQGQWRKATLLDESDFFAKLDEHCTKGQIHWIDHWIDRYLQQGEQFDRILHLLCKWFSGHRTINALELVAAAIIHAGVYRDLDLLCINGIEPALQAEAIVADARFAVRRRSLV